MIVIVVQIVRVVVAINIKKKRAIKDVNLKNAISAITNQINIKNAINLKNINATKTNVIKI
jgi:hypothetical protein